MRIPVLTYHATNISGNDYHTNDHIALRSDLYVLSQLGIKIISAMDLVKWIRGDIELSAQYNYAVLTFDDGTMLDFRDWHHPLHGFQSSFFHILNSHNDEVHATSFVIASPKDRKILEKTCMGGHEIWGDDWWQEAEDCLKISVQNHSWDHVHITLDKVSQKENIKGDFSKIECYEDAKKQINQASDYINSQIKNKQTQLFAYPYGDYNDYLVEEYFPNQQNDIIGAFSCDPNHASENSNVWKIPRYMCGLHWKNPAQFKNILLQNTNI